MCLKSPAARAALLAILTAGCAGGAAPAPAEGPAADMPDIERFSGRWFVLASSRGVRKAGQVGAFVDYLRDRERRIEERWSARAGSFEQPAELQQTFHWIPDSQRPGTWREDGWSPFGREEYRILYVDGNYRYALAGGESWAVVLAREADVPEWIYAGLLGRLSSLGHDVTKLRRIPQRPDQVGLPAFR